MTKGITLLGGFQVCDHSRVLTGFQSDKARALLAYLAVEADRAHRRAQLAGLFWPEWPEQTALTYLRHALANLRKVLGDQDNQEPLLLVTRHTIQFNKNAACQLDIALVMGALQSLTAPTPAIDQLQQAVAAYRYSFLEGFYLNGCAAFEEWVVATRERLQRQIVDALHHLSTHFEAQGDYPQARHYAQRRVDLEPWLEEAYRQLMRLYALSGQRSAALIHYEQCRNQLAAELGVEPSTETKVLYEAIRTGQFDKVTRWQEPLLRATKDDKVTSNKVAQMHPVTPSPKQNLPAPTTPLLGRSQELSALQTLLQREDVRLVTVSGTGGIGKTRLALQVATNLLTSFADGTYLVPLALIRAANRVPLAIAQTLGVRETGNCTLLASLVHYLRDKALLLVLDNFEHVVNAAPLLTDLLAHCPQLKILVTSREVLHLRGEHEYGIPALAVPATLPATLPTPLAHYAAVQLFIQRAQAVKPDFIVDHASVRAMVEICMRLDGLPLAIELAAARCKFFSPQVLLQKLATSPLAVLRSGARDMPERHQTLHNAIAWSYHLLNTTERKLFQRLAVFVGGFKVEAAAFVCTLATDQETDETIDMGDRLLSLVDKNLIRQEAEVDGEVCFMMLETIREFGLAQLAESDELVTIQQRHADYYNKLAHELCPQLIGPASVRALAQMRMSFPNIRTALQWLLHQRAVEDTLRLCNVLIDYWDNLYSREAVVYLEAAAALAGDHPPTSTYVNFLASAGYVLAAFDDRGLARRFFEQCLAMNQVIGNLGDPKRIGMANGLLGWLHFDQGNYQAARAYLAAAKENDLATGDEWALAMTLANQGKMEAKLGEFERAQHLLQEALARHQRIGDVWSIALTLNNQSLLYILQNRFEEAVDTVAQSHRLGEEIQAGGALATIYRLSALIALHHGEHRKANSFLKAVLLICQKTTTPRGLLEVLETVVQATVKQDKLYTGLVLAGAISACRRKLQVVAPPVEKQLMDDAVMVARQQLVPDASATAWAKGESMTLDEAVAYAVAEVE